VHLTREGGICKQQGCPCEGGVPIIARGQLLKRIIGETRAKKRGLSRFTVRQKREKNTPELGAVTGLYLHRFFCGKEKGELTRGVGESYVDGSERKRGELRTGDITNGAQVGKAAKQNRWSPVNSPPSRGVGKKGPVKRRKTPII